MSDVIIRNWSPTSVTGVHEPTRGIEYEAAVQVGSKIVWRATGERLMRVSAMTSELGAFGYIRDLPSHTHYLRRQGKESYFVEK